MIHAAHASRYHWMHAGTVVNAVRGEWQCSRVYATLGRAEPAVAHARRALELYENASDDAEDFDLPFCYEALARAHAVAGEPDEARKWLDLARQTGSEIAEDDDRELLMSDLATIPL